VSERKARTAILPEVHRMLSLSSASSKQPARSSSPSLTAKTCLALGLGLSALGASAHAQTQTGPKPTPDVAPSKLDIYGGYGYIRPFSSLSYNGGEEYKDVSNSNATLGLSYFFTHHIGFEVKGEYFSAPSARGAVGQCVNGACSDRDQMYYLAEAGPVIRAQYGRFIPFAHLLLGGAKVNGPFLQPLTWGEGGEVGGGADYVLPYFHNLLALRAQANIDGIHAKFYPDTIRGVNGGVADIIAFKASGGVVLRLGSQTVPPPVALSCSATPPSIFPGDPVTVTGVATGLNPKKKVTYTYTSTGGVVAPAGETATLDTKGLAAGSYTVSGMVSEGPKPREMANCSAGFAVKAFEPPTLSCSASPSSLMAGDTATITSTGVSPQNRPLTYSYSASSGQVSGSGATVTLATSGLPQGTIDVTCTVVDDLGQKATSQTSVVIQNAAPLPPKPTSQSLCSIQFDRDTKRPTRVDNEGKACLDDLALSLQRSTDATLDVVGNAASAEKDGTQKAAERAVNTKDYLVKEKGIDATRIAVFTGTDDSKVVTTTLVPSGATPVTATPVDENAVKPQPRKPLGMHHHHGKKHKK
jgi:outer membrane protein OmpA-like peptidoglycan-associated protein